MKPLTKVGIIVDGTINLLAVLASIVLIFIMLLVVSEVILRASVGQSIFWEVEVSEYSLVFITFLGAAWVLRREGHVKVELLLDRLNPQTQALFNVVTSILCAISTLALTWYSAQSTWDMFRSGFVIITPLRPLKWPLLAIIPVGSLLLFIQFLRRTHDYFRRWRELSE